MNDDNIEFNKEAQVRNNIHVAAMFRQLCMDECASMPFPGEGKTLQRWRSLNSVAERDLCVAKLYESHFDALAILHEAKFGNVSFPAAEPLWAVWCSENPASPLVVQTTPNSDIVTLNGTKSWCSGLDMVDFALVSCQDKANRRYLVAVDLRQTGISKDFSHWHALGMRETGTGQCTFREVSGSLIGTVDFYIDRPGFWHGGAGIAACWFGASHALATFLRTQLTKKSVIDPHAMVHLGKVEGSLACVAAYLRQLADKIDKYPAHRFVRDTAIARLMAEKLAEEVIVAVGHAGGPAMYCQDAWCAKMLADLPVFIRQSHAERDWEQNGKACLNSEDDLWAL